MGVRRIRRAMSQATAPAGGGGRLRGVSEKYLRGGEPAGTHGHEKSTAAETLARGALRSGLVFLVFHVSHAITSDSLFCCRLPLLLLLMMALSSATTSPNT